MTALRVIITAPHHVQRRHAERASGRPSITATSWSAWALARSYSPGRAAASFTSTWSSTSRSTCTFNVCRHSLCFHPSGTSGLISARLRAGFRAPCPRPATRGVPDRAVHLVEPAGRVAAAGQSSDQMAAAGHLHGHGPPGMLADPANTSSVPDQLSVAPAARPSAMRSRAMTRPPGQSPRALPCRDAPTPSTRFSRCTLAASIFCQVRRNGRFSLDGGAGRRGTLASSR